MKGAVVWAGIGILAAGGWVFADQDGENIVEPLGACTVTPDSLECWDMAGRPSKSLTDRIKAKMSASDQFPPLKFKAGETPVYLVVRLDGHSRVDLNSSYGSLFPLILAEDDKTSLWMYLYVRRDDETKGRLRVLSFDYGRSPTLTLPVRKGAKGTLAGKEILIWDWKPVNGLGVRWGGTFGRQAPIWGIFCGGPAPADRFANLNIEALDGRGREIKAVDAKGQPVDTKVFIEWMKEYSKAPTPNPKYNAVHLTVPFLGSEDRAFGIQSPIDPARIAKLRFIDLKTDRRVIDTFPLKPLNSSP